MVDTMTVNIKFSPLLSLCVKSAPPSAKAFSTFSCVWETAVCKIVCPLTCPFGSAPSSRRAPHTEQFPLDTATASSLVKRVWLENGVAKNLSSTCASSFSNKSSEPRSATQVNSSVHWRGKSESLASVKWVLSMGSARSPLSALRQPRRVCIASSLVRDGSTRSMFKSFRPIKKQDRPFIGI